MSQAKKGLFDWYFKSNLLVRIMIGLILGAIVGGVLAATTAPGEKIKILPYIVPFGDAFIRLLKMIIVPVVFFTLVVGTSSIQPSRLGRVGVKIMAYYLITTFMAAIIGLILALIARPGMGVNLSVGTGEVKLAANKPISQVILELIPENVFGAFTNNGMILQVIFFALMVGVALAFLRDSKDARIKNAAETVYAFFDGFSEAMYLVVRWIMQYAPIGVFALMVNVFALNGPKVAGPLISVVIVVYVGLVIQAVFVYGGFLTVNKMNPFGFFKKARSPMLTAFVTRSSGGTLPITMKTADNMGVSRGVYSFTLPLGATINMDGTTIYQAVCAVFIANAVGSPLTFSQMVMVVVVCVLASIGTAGVPGAGAIMLLMVLESVGLKVETGSVIAAAYAMIFGIDALLDMGRTCINVTGDLVGTTVVAKSENEFDVEKYNAYTGADIA